MEENAMTGRHRGARVLVAEDDPIQLEVLAAMVADTGAECVAVSNGQEALEKYRSAPEGHFQLVLTDINMPEMGGLELCHRIRLAGRADSETLPILGISADENLDVFDCAVRSGMNGMAAKPVSAEVLHSYFTLVLGAGRMNTVFAARLQSRVEHDRRIREFAEDVCRELRVPMQAIVGFAEMLAEKTVADADRISYAESVATAATRVAKLMNDAEIRFASGK